MGIVWTKDMVIDEGIIDADHQVLIEIINQFERIPSRSLNNAVLLAILEKLEKYTEMHFGREERLQELVQFGLRFPHLKAHQGLIKTLENLKAKLSETKPEDIEAFTVKLKQFLADWLTNHILVHDMKMRPYVAEIKKKQHAQMSLQDLMALQQAKEDKAKEAKKGLRSKTA